MEVMVTLVLSMPQFLAQKMELTRFLRMLLTVYQTIRRHDSENCNHEFLVSTAMLAKFQVSCRITPCVMVNIDPPSTQ
jgi:hypothetical protein